MTREARKAGATHPAGALQPRRDGTCDEEAMPSKPSKRAQARLEHIWKNDRGHHHSHRRLCGRAVPLRAARQLGGELRHACMGDERSALPRTYILGCHPGTGVPAFPARGLYGDHGGWRSPPPVVLRVPCTGQYVHPLFGPVTRKLNTRTRRRAVKFLSVPCAHPVVTTASVLHRAFVSWSSKA